MRSFAITCAALLSLACASEEWDNRFDPESSSYRKPCQGVPSELAATCVFWEEFDRGLAAWSVDDPQPGSKPIRVLPESLIGDVATVLAVPGCKDADPARLHTEIALPQAPVRLSIVWKPAPGSGGRLAVSLNGAEQQIDTGQAEEFDTWQESSVDLTGIGGTDLLLGILNLGGDGDTCADVGIMVARVFVGKPGL